MDEMYYLAGHAFALKNVEFGIHSDETTDFVAELWCDGKFLCRCSNDGQGGATSTYCAPETRERYIAVGKDVAKEVWLICCDGRKINHDLGTVADEVLFRI